jgi:hypothetical protein
METVWIIRIVDVLPAPLGPRRPRHSPRRIWKSMPSTARVSPKLLCRPPASTRMSGPPGAELAGGLRSAESIAGWYQQVLGVAEPPAGSRQGGGR